MDLGQRQSAIEQIETETLARQREHVARVERLETEHGMDLDVLTDIYGNDFLRRTQTSQEELAKFETFYDVLAADERFLCVGGISQKLRDGCYGFGAKEKYDPEYRIALFDQRGPKVRIEYLNQSDDRHAAIVLHGLGAVVIPRQEKPHPKHISEVSFEIASPATVAKPWFTSLDIVLSDETTYGLGSKFYSVKSAGGYDNVGMWYHDWLDARKDEQPTNVE